MRLCEATMPEVPSGVGWTGVAYSFGYSAFCASTAWRSFSSASVSGTVRIQVIRSYGFQGGRDGRSAKRDKIYRHAQGDDADAQRRLQRTAGGYQDEHHSRQNEKQRGREGIAPGPK